MKNYSNPDFLQKLNHLYISPLERCNLRCKICYTRKTNHRLNEKEILDFIERYEKVKKLESVTFCGGEVFMLPYFPNLVNNLTSRIILVQIITNGTIDRLKELRNPNLINLIVSLDGLPYYHDKNRGVGNFKKSLTFLKKVNQLGFHSEIFSIVTRQNVKQVEKFENYLREFLGFNIPITYHPRKPIKYLIHHPVSNTKGVRKGFDFLTKKEMLYLMSNKKTFPPKNLGCFQISLMSDGKVYGCCDGTVPVGTISHKIEVLINNLRKRYKDNNLLCSQPDFVCGIKEYI